MDFRKRDRAVEGCNWLMVGVAAGWVVYTFAGSFSSTADTQATLLPPAVVSPPSPTEVAPVPTWGAETSKAEPAYRAAASRQNRAPRATSAPDPRADWVYAPEVPIDPLSTLPPGVGPDF